MNIKTEEAESDVVSLDREFVIKHQEPVGVDISVVMEDDSRYECLVRLQPCGDPSLYTIRLATRPLGPEDANTAARTKEALMITPTTWISG